MFKQTEIVTLKTICYECWRCEEIIVLIPVIVDFFGIIQLSPSSFENPVYVTIQEL